MNLILFEPDELARPLPRDDRRAQHLTAVLRRGPGERFDAGIVNGPRGKATIVATGPEGLTLAFTAEFPPPPPDPIQLVIGLPRPQTARDILRDATTLGAGALHFVRTEKAEPSYATSSLWTSGEWRRHVIAGAEQAFDTRIPEVTVGETLEATLGRFSAAAGLALDNYEAAAPLSTCEFPATRPLVLALGPERGWSAVDREILRRHAFRLVHLGPRVLRTEAAVLASLTLARARLGLM